MSLDRSVDSPVMAASSACGGPQLRRLSLRVNFAWTLAGNAIYLGAQAGMLMVVAKLGSKEMVGRFSLAFAICAPLVMLTNLQLRNVQATDARDEYTFRDYFALRLLATGLALLVIVGIACAVGLRSPLAPVVLLIGLAKAVESISDVIFGFWQRNERLDLIGISYMIKGSASLIAMWVAMRMTHTVTWACAALFATWTLVTIGYDFGNLWRLARAELWGGGNALASLLTASRLRTTRQLAVIAFPLGLVGMLDSLNTNAPRYVVEHNLGEAALGVFAATASLMVAGSMVIAALAQSASARLARHYVEDIGAFTRLLLKLVAFGVGLGALGVLGAIWFGRPLLSLLYRPDYASYAPVLVWLMVAAGLVYISKFLVISMIVARQFRAQTPLYAIMLAAIAALSYWLVPRTGLYGAAYALCAGALILLLGAALINVRAIRCRYRQKGKPEALEPRAVSSAAEEGVL